MTLDLDLNRLTDDALEDLILEAQGIKAARAEAAQAEHDAEASRLARAIQKARAKACAAMAGGSNA